MTRAVLRTLVLLLLVSAFVFGATELLPSDAAETRTGRGATAAQLVDVRADLGLDRPGWRRYLAWLAGLARGDAGTSLVTDRPVAAIVAERLPATLTLAGCALVVAVPLTLLGAWLVGTASSRWRFCVTGVASVPQVVFAAWLAVVFAGVLGWLPPVSLLPVEGSPLSRPELLVLPTAALAVPAAAFGAGLLGGAVSDTVRRPHVRDAVARGLPPHRVAVRHVAPFLLAPAVRVLALMSGMSLAATAVVEIQFGYAGLGELLVGSIGTRDTPVVQAVAMLAAVAVLAGSAVADVLGERR
ncbi:ABC transporter permease [Thermomonospora umbrina]|uniref:Peptide/nickel transport system permease protein n=1 Tax=Thermomonospora umbrina TaxID=111806 RepID=A0A3D9SKY7_9ACTN|nr:ABC transporter permease [Thermomonospora umbrina]REE95070.1 peptide/nickel transport system permease protein [Thermomonospora umbrina]